MKKNLGAGLRGFSKKQVVPQDSSPQELGYRPFSGHPSYEYIHAHGQKEMIMWIQIFVWSRKLICWELRHFQTPDFSVDFRELLSGSPFLGSDISLGERMHFISIFRHLFRDNPKNYMFSDIFISGFVQTGGYIFFFPATKALGIFFPAT